ncbi:MAG: ATP-binding protein, partial [Dolichospermum sp.]
FERDTQHIFQTIWTRCNRTEQALLMLIALLDVDGHIADKKFNLNGIERILSQLKRWLSELEDKGVIISSSTETGKFYSFTSPLMKKWVTEEILNTSDNLIRDREKEFLNLISHGQMRQVGEFISWLKNNPDTVKQCLNWQ